MADWPPFFDTNVLSRAFVGRLGTQRGATELGRRYGVPPLRARPIP